jgi:hypothetical protein
MSKIKLGMDKLSVAQLLELAKQIVTAMTGNTNFPTPNPTLTQLTTATNNLDTARQEALVARNVAKTKTLVQNQQQDELRAMLRKMVAYVENVGGEDEAIITSAGMSVKAAATSGGDVAIVDGVAFTMGDNDNEVDFTWDSTSGAQSYIIQMSATPPPNAAWTQIKTVTKSKGTLTGLASGQRCWFRVAAISASGQSPWSDISSCVVP